MFNLLDYNQQVTANTTVARSVTLTLHSESHAFLNAGRNVERNQFLLTFNTFAMTVGALLFHNLTFTLTLRTHANGFLLAKDCLHNLTHRARSVTSGACAQ